MRIYFLVITLILFVSVSAQEDPGIAAAPIVQEGKHLYKLEMASWHGTDIFLAAYKDRSNIAGYFSYLESSNAKCIFFSGAATPTVIGTITFDSSYNLNTATIDLSERYFTKREKELHLIRQNALNAVKSDTMFKSYNNSNLNFIPLINAKEKKVFILTGPSVEGVVIFGNDYLIEFDDNNKIISQKALHKNIIPIYLDKEGTTSEEGEITMHTHLPETGDYITSTDICTLMMYSKFTNWKQHNVVSKNYLNIWDCMKNQLSVIPMETIRKITEDQKKRRNTVDENKQPKN